MAATDEKQRSVVVPATPQSVGDVRHFVDTHLRQTGLVEDLVDTATLLVSEIVTNAVLHARTEISVECSVQGSGVLVEVTDGSRLLPTPRHHETEAVSGRGLELVELLADGYGVRCARSGKVVWFTLGGASSPSPKGWTPQEAGEEVAVVVPGVPVMLYEVLQEHNEALLREYELYQLRYGGDGQRGRDIADAARARVRIASCFRACREEGPASATEVDVRLVVPVVERAGFEKLLPVLDDAEAAAAKGILLTRPALPELLALRDWLYGQVRAQLDGGVPVPWTPPEEYTRDVAAPPADVDVAWVRRTARPVVVADDTNHILAISDAAADLLGWTPAGLVGERVMAIVPPSLRQAHVAGFTRQIVTGREVLIGREVTVPALTSTGGEVQVRLRIERTTSGPRIVYVAWLEPC